MSGDLSSDVWPWADKSDLASKAEMFETPEWAPEAVLDAEVLTPLVIDPCCGRGVLAEAAKRRGHNVAAFDLHDWGYGLTGIDFLKWRPTVDFMKWPDVDFTVLMNAPFSLADEFVRHALELGARKVVAFQRFAWWESNERTDFWRDCRPARIHVCRSRASCWRLDIPPEKRKGRGGSTAYAWFVWERGHAATAALSHLDRKKEAA
ncbi:MAG: hypothetical protein HQL45_15740 [Alphaproteobacteria bacterium]|nr:hypothetical protein [Alphaproteobacteria bacterium]